MNTLLVKLNATGDVVRTTVLLRRLDGAVTWVTAARNAELLDGAVSRCLAWDDRQQALDRRYDLVISLEDDSDTAAFVSAVDHDHRFGAYLDGRGQVSYTEDSRSWFDMSLISVHGRKQADALKLVNRRTFQELIFGGLGFRFDGEEYVLPEPIATGLVGDVAIAPVAGPVWPMKGWAHYDILRRELELSGLTVNVLPRRDTLREHLGDVRGHRCLVGGDSLPMHLALGVGTACVTLFNCTSPWEIYDYGRQTKIVSPLLERYFYQRGYDERAVTAIGLEQVYDAVVARLEGRNSPVPRAL